MNLGTYLVIALAVSVLVGFLIGRAKRRPVLGALLGIFGIIGWIIIAIIPSKSSA